MPVDDAFRARLESLPDRPGVYSYLDAKGETLYVGKAVSLRSRVRSYFQPSARHSPRIARLVEEVADFRLIVVDTEMEALILESNLIKKHRPRYNVVLRDDKQFPYLKLSTEDAYPRVSLVRRARLDGNLYVGPFTPTWVARKTLKMIPRYFQVATCGEVFDGKRRPCLYYHLDQCLAPCAGKTNPAEYGEAVGRVKLFLQGRHDELERSLQDDMRRASETQEFERAARFRDAIETIRKMTQKQQIATAGREHQDYLAHHRDGTRAVLQLFQMREGRFQGRREFSFDDLEDFDAAAFYREILIQYYAEVEPPPEIFVPAIPADAELLSRWLRERAGRKVDVKVPQRGLKRRFMALARRNARVAFESHFKGRHTWGVKALEALGDVLGLTEAPYRIECFDVSNLQGSDPVASMIVWEGGRAKKSAYRSYNLRSVDGPDDYASMAEVVTRRYRRQIAEERRLPDLILIDGGPGQLGAAVRALTEVGLPTVPVISLAKREEEIYLQRGGEPLALPRDSPALQLVQRIRDEAHRFAITRHRGRRTRRTLTTSLREVRGVGEVTARKLLESFGSVTGVEGATPEELESVVGKALAGRIVTWRQRRTAAAKER